MTALRGSMSIKSENGSSCSSRSFRENIFYQSFQLDMKESYVNCNSYFNGLSMSKKMMFPLLLYFID